MLALSRLMEFLQIRSRKKRIWQCTSHSWIRTTSLIPPTTPASLNSSCTSASMLLNSTSTSQTKSKLIKIKTTQFGALTLQWHPSWKTTMITSRKWLRALLVRSRLPTNIYRTQRICLTRPSTRGWKMSSLINSSQNNMREMTLVIKISSKTMIIREDRTPTLISVSY